MGIYFANVGHLPTNEKTIAEILKRRGYSTGHFGKWHLGTLTTKVKDSNRGRPGNETDYSPPQDHGFDVCFSTEAKVPTHNPMLKRRRAGKSAWDAIEPSQFSDEDVIQYGTRYWDENGKEVTKNLVGDDSKLIMDRALDFIDASAKSGKPFLSVVWLHSPHLPVVASQEDVRPFADLPVLHRNYLGCVAALDAQIGRLRKRLRKIGIEENTVVFFCSDNGPEGNMKAPGSAGGLRGRKRSLYEGGIRVPGIIEWPAKIKKAVFNDTPASTSDYLPTILDILDVELPSDRPIDGVSLMPFIKGAAAIRDSFIGFQSKKQQALIGNQYKIYRSTPESDWQLFDLQDDPKESIDLASQFPETVKGMSDVFREWKKSCDESDAKTKQSSGKEKN